MKKKDDGVDVEGRAPGFFLYPSDLERELRPLPVGAQALWTRMFLQMHWAKRRGYLEHSTGEPFTADDIARMVGMPLASVNRHLAEMETKYGTFSRDERGVIFNRRMVRDTEISLKRKEAGRQGGNPVLVGNLDKQNPDLDKQNENLDNQTSNQNGTRGSTRARSSSSTSISTSVSSSDDDKVAAGEAAEFPETAAAVRGYFRSADDALIVVIARKSMQAYADVVNGHTNVPPLTDAILAEAIHEAKFKKQYSPGPFMESVPRVVKSWAEEAIRNGSIH